MTLSAYEYVDARPRGEGCDYNVGGRVILRFKEARIVWRPGSTGWSGIGMRDYYKATLYAENVPDGTVGRKNFTILEGGRLSQKRWAKARESIAYRLKVPMDWIPKELPISTVTIT